MQVDVQGLTIKANVFKPDDRSSFQVQVNVTDLAIYDHITTSTVNRMLTAMRSTGAQRRTTNDMISVHVEGVRPDLSMPLNEELRMKVELRPLRVNMHQYALNFFKVFFQFKAPASQLAARLPVAPDAYIQLFEIKPVDIKIDYMPDHVDFKYDLLGLGISHLF